ncbi:hypothetical protein PPNSA23_22440 [Phyllobacterium phragmitis]|uniref:Uncharacterized protein n=1 Tax=Phyllobacterium phragmitis TaxID=2670329 RepID=A0ABQ0H063_9HYPH
MHVWEKRLDLNLARWGDEGCRGMDPSDKHWDDGMEMLSPYRSRSCRAERLRLAANCKAVVIPVLDTGIHASPVTLPQR